MHFVEHKELSYWATVVSNDRKMLITATNGLNKKTVCVLKGFSFDLFESRKSNEEKTDNPPE
jgi:hypothetical protein